MKFKDKEPVLVLVDMQMGFKDEAHWGGNRNNPQMEENLQNLLKLWRDKDLPVVHVKHKSTSKQSLLHKKNDGCKLMPEFEPMGTEPLFKKKVNSAFIGTKLEQFLVENQYRTLVFGGMTTNHCISTSVRMSGNLGFRTFVIDDGTATFDRIGADGTKYDAELVHNIALASLNEEFAKVVSSAKIEKLINSLHKNE